LSTAAIPCATNTARVIPWEVSEGIGGVAIELPNGRSADYEVGSKADAVIECRRIEDSKPPMFGPWVRMDLTERH
jgi:hypothetical protein